MIIGPGKEKESFWTIFELCEVIGRSKPLSINAICRSCDLDVCLQGLTSCGAGYRSSPSGGRCAKGMQGCELWRHAAAALWARVVHVIVRGTSSSGMLCPSSPLQHNPTHKLTRGQGTSYLPSPQQPGVPPGSPCAIPPRQQGCGHHFSTYHCGQMDLTMESAQHGKVLPPAVQYIRSPK